jgi:hypothetical protein
LHHKYIKDLKNIPIGYNKKDFGISI